MYTELNTYFSQCNLMSLSEICKKALLRKLSSYKNFNNNFKIHFRNVNNVVVWMVVLYIFQIS